MAKKAFKRLRISNASALFETGICRRKAASRACVVSAGVQP
jgi:hypothetical protein